MNQNRWLVCFLVGSFTPALVLGNWEQTAPQDKISPEDQDVPSKQLPANGLGQRVFLWLLSVAAIYGVVHLLEDFSPEMSLHVEQQEGEVAKCDTCVVRTPPFPKRICPIQARLRDLEQREQEMVTLLYKLHNYKKALAAICNPRDQPSSTRHRNLPSDVVVYKIYE